MARSQRAVNWQGSAGMHESCKNNPFEHIQPSSILLGAGWRRRRPAGAA
jgi:hypothetical protein